MMIKLGGLGSERAEAHAVKSPYCTVQAVQLTRPIDSESLSAIRNHPWPSYPVLSCATCRGFAGYSNRYERWVDFFTSDIGEIRSKKHVVERGNYTRPAGGSPGGVPCVLARVSHITHASGFALVRTCEYNKNADSFKNKVRRSLLWFSSETAL